MPQEQLQQSESAIINDDFEIHYLAGHLDVSADDIRTAIAQVGGDRADVEAFFRDKTSK